MPRNLGWYARSATRSYPLDDAASGLDDAGTPLPTDILLDLRLRFPRTLGGRAQLTAVTCSEALVSLLFSAVPDADASSSAAASSHRPLAALSVARAQLTTRRIVPLDPLAAGVVGWGVLGPGVDHPTQLRFSTPAQGLLLPSAAAPYAPARVTSLGRARAETALSGVVRLESGQDLVLEVATRRIEGVERDVILVRLRDDPALYTAYAGPCGGRPESQTCQTEALEAIEGVTPDAAGDLRLRVPFATLAPFTAGGGLALVWDQSVADLCARKATTLPAAGGVWADQALDLCDSSLPPEESVPAESSSPPPEPTPCDETVDYRVEPFALPETGWTQPYGAWTLGAGPTGQTLDTSSPPLGTNQAMLTCDAVGRLNLSIWDAFPKCDVLDCLVIAVGRPGIAATPAEELGSVHINWGVVLNYFEDTSGLYSRPRFIYACVNVASNSFDLWRYDGREPILLRRLPALPNYPAMFPQTWTRIVLQATPGEAPGTVNVSAAFFPVTGGAQSMVHNLPVAEFGAPYGTVGVGSYESRAMIGGFACRMPELPDIPPDPPIPDLPPFYPWRRNHRE